ncbi:hypothetical protein FIBSPDRAFT_860702 [Athelia psychrophila]|uniref:Uncharacterized protein n=1 Tax=Athelia psychrophila TaxID=1759441 RepID=A0A166JVI7_9AGAM|nr:hypothetical protein FIBSPDRAFT_860702 [Fibularhizoctonia sp. CBS 109695]
MSYADLSEARLQLHSPISHDTYHTYQVHRIVAASHSSNEKVRRDASIRRLITCSSHH